MISRLRPSLIFLQIIVVVIAIALSFNASCYAEQSKNVNTTWIVKYVNDAMNEMVPIWTSVPESRNGIIFVAINPAGKVTKCEMSHSTGDKNRDAQIVALVRKWKFVPMTWNPPAGAEVRIQTSLAHPISRFQHLSAGSGESYTYESNGSSLDLVSKPSVSDLSSWSTPSPLEGLEKHKERKSPVVCDLGPAYEGDLRRRLRRNWEPGKDALKRVVTQFKIHADGTVFDVKVTKSSGVATADRAAVKAIESAAPFRKLPEGKTEAAVTFEFGEILFDSP